MIENALANSSSNPPERSALNFDIEPPTNFPVVNKIASSFDVNAKSLSTYRDTLNAIKRSQASVALNLDPLTSSLGASLGPSGFSLVPFIIRVSHPQIPGSIKGKVLPRDLLEALTELQLATREAVEEEFETPSVLALTNAGRLLREMYAIVPQRFEVYPTPDAEIAIRALAPGRSVIVLCESGGGAVCLVNVNSGRRRNRCSSADALLDSFLEKALLDLKAESD